MGDENEGQGQNVAGTTEYGNNPFLADVADEDLAVVGPYLKKWQGNITKEFDKRNREWEEYKPLKDAGLSIDDINQAIALTQYINEDPQKAAKELADYAGITLTEAQGAIRQQQEENNQVIGDSSADAFVNHPEFKKQQQLIEQLAEAELKRTQSVQADSDQQALNQALSEMKTKFSDRGDFDESYVLMQMAHRVPIEQAVENYYKMVETAVGKATSAHSNAPKLPGGSATIASGQFDPTKLSRAETKDMVKEYLARAAETNQQ